MPNLVILILGCLICGAVALQTIGWFVSYSREWRHESKIFEDRQRLLKERIAHAVATRQQHDLSRPAWQGYRKFVVHSKIVETMDTVSLYLVPQDQHPLPPFMPGQFITLKAEADGQSVGMQRSYSLSDRPREEFFRLTIKRHRFTTSGYGTSGQRAGSSQSTRTESLDATGEVEELKRLKSLARQMGGQQGSPDEGTTRDGLVSGWIHESLTPGQVIDVKAPSGGFTMDVRQKRPAILIGAGIGITPLYSMIAEATYQQSERQLVLFQCVRDGQHHVFRSAFQQLATMNRHLKIVNCYSQPSSSDLAGQDFDLAGRLNVETLLKLLPSLNYEFYLCGPQEMLDSLSHELTRHGVPSQHLHRESFGAPRLLRPDSVRAEVPPTKNELGHHVRFAESGKSISWTGSESSLLEAAEENGIVMSSACRKGVCGSCVTRLAAGSVSYEACPEFELEDGECLPCIAKPSSDLELEA